MPFTRLFSGSNGDLRWALALYVTPILSKVNSPLLTKSGLTWRRGRFRTRWNWNESEKRKHWKTESYVVFRPNAPVVKEDNYHSSIWITDVSVTDCLVDVESVVSAPQVTNGDAVTEDCLQAKHWYIPVFKKKKQESIFLFSQHALGVHINARSRNHPGGFRSFSVSVDAS